MKKTILSLKKHVPDPLWQAVRRARQAGADLARSLGPSVRSMDYCGLKVFYNSGNSIVRRLKKEPVFEREMCEAIVAELGKGRSEKGQEPVFLDIGANIGLVSAYVVSNAPGVIVHAFEPGPAQGALLERTVAANGLEQRLLVHSEALGAEAGDMTFYVHDPKEMGKDGLADTGRGGAAAAVSVRMTTLDDWWRGAGMPPVAAVKIDTEGAELLVLRGARKLIETAKPVVYLEICALNLQAYPYAAGDILDFLDRNGYDLSTVSGCRVTASDLQDALKSTETFLASPRR